MLLNINHLTNTFTYFLVLLLKYYSVIPLLPRISSYGPGSFYIFLIREDFGSINKTSVRLLMGHLGPKNVGPWSAQVPTYRLYSII